MRHEWKNTNLSDIHPIIRGVQKKVMEARINGGILQSSTQNAEIALQKCWSDQATVFYSPFMNNKAGKSVKYVHYIRKWTICFTYHL